MYNTDKKPKDKGTPIFGLNKFQLLPVIQNAVDESIKDFQVSINRNATGKHYGFTAQKLISTFSYITNSNRRGEIKMFVKWFHDPSPDRESFHYKHLTEINAPIPKLYGSIDADDPAKREIVFIEYIKPYPGYRPYSKFLMDKENLLQFISLTAHLDTLKLPQNYAERLTPWLPHEAYDNSLEGCIMRINKLWDDAHDGKLSQDIATVCTDQALEQLYVLSENIVKIEFPPATCLEHDCYEPCHIGWRENTGEMLVFDLQPMALAPRFANIAPWLGEPENLQPRCMSIKELSRFYLREYIRRGGEPISLDQFMLETANNWLCTGINLLNRWRNNILEGNTVYRKLLLNLIKCLLNFQQPV